MGSVKCAGAVPVWIFSMLLDMMRWKAQDLASSQTKIDGTGIFDPAIQMGGTFWHGTTKQVGKVLENHPGETPPVWVPTPAHNRADTPPGQGWWNSFHS